jgi:hypothetical protein
MTDLRDAAQQALKSLRGYRREIGCEQPCDAERALEVALEQPEQPLAWLESPYGLIRMNTTMRFQFPPQSLKWKIPLYTHPLRREWRGLKEWEINDGLDQLPTEDVCSWSFRKGVYFAEAALKQRNV